MCRVQRIRAATGIPSGYYSLGRCARQTRQCQGCAYEYDEALIYAPNWKRLKFARESLTKRAG
jgi:hypothetical protein